MSGNVTRQPVEQLDPGIGKALAEFSSSADAARATNGNRDSVARVCKGDRKTAYGFLWRYGNGIGIEQSVLNKKGVQQLCPGTHKVLANFDSIREASRQTGFSECGIIKCCNGHQQATGGYAWRFAHYSKSKATDKRSKVKKEPSKQKPLKKTSSKIASKPSDTLWEFHGIIGHTGHYPKTKGCPYKLVIDWKGNWKPTEEPLDFFYEQYPKLFYNYSKDNGLLENPEWKKYVPWMIVMMEWKQRMLLRIHPLTKTSKS